MHKLTICYDVFLAASLMDELQQADIPYILKDENSSSMGEIAPISSGQQIWIIKSGDLLKAQSILKQLEPPSEHGSFGLRRCSHCGEMLEPQFASCWKCNTPFI